MKEQIQRIKTNHEMIANLSQEKLVRVFGSGKHKFKLNPPASLNQVVEHEQKFQFSFPEGYRRFILEVGDGGAGPFHGIKKRFMEIGSTLRNEEAKLFHLESIYKGLCPETEEWQKIVIDPNYEDILENDEGICYQGNLLLFEVGCGTEGVLVLNGPMEGAVCITDYGFTPYSFWEPPQFLDVYESWQEAVLNENKKHAFGF